MLDDPTPFHPDHPNQPWSQKCVCGKTYMQPNSYALHVGNCKEMRERLGKTLKEARERRGGSTRNGDEGQPPSEVAEGRRRKRKCAWLDDANLDVDVVTRPSSSTTTRGSQTDPMMDRPEGSGACGGILANANGDHSNPGDVQGVAASHLANARSSSPSFELGKGCRTKNKKLSHKVQPNRNCLPSSTLPTSISPPTQPLPSGESNSIPHDAPAKAIPSAPPTPVTLVTIKTDPNSFGLYKIYHSDSRDTPHDPDNSTIPVDLREKPSTPVDPLPNSSQGVDLHPFPNMSSFRLGEWYWSDGSGKSAQSFQDLLSIVGSDDFKPSDIREANWTEIDRRLAGSALGNGEVDIHLEEGDEDRDISWNSSTITINVPIRKGLQNSGSHEFAVPGFHHRHLVPVIRAKLESSEGREYFHTLGHELRWKPGEGKADTRVYGELYNSPAFIQAYEDLQASPLEPDCKHPRHIIGLMFASDATMLASFGTAKLWPLYMCYANDSKYRRSKPSEKLFETIAYFEKLPDRFKDFVIGLSGKETVAAALITHCHRELFQEQWKLILDDEFIEAYCHGILVTCYDGIQRRFYPRIFIYSADYPEKILLASIKNLGLFPCPRCTIPMKNVQAMGQKRDRHNRERLARHDDDACRKVVSEARAFIYEKKYAVTADAVEAKLSEGSMVPSENGFSHKLSAHGFDLFRMLVVDFMHEFELGVWKAIFIQLLRLLQATDKGHVNVLDKRYRSMPTFGKDTIRRFVNNVSEMKQLAARDFEDLLQCAIPAFEDLLPSPHNKTVTELLFTLAQFHGLAKLRLHTDHTVAKLDTLTTKLGDQLRAFVKNTCTKFDTKELAREYQARKRREARTERRHVSGKRRKASSGKPVASEESEEASDSRKGKTLNLSTYKFHSLGDIVPTIKMFGTTDSYSSQTPESFHRYGKRHYKRTSKRNVSRQISRIETRQARIRKLRKQLLPDPAECYVDDEASQFPYFIGKSQNNPVNLPTFLQKKRDDPATKGFYSNLRRHLLPRVYSMLLEEVELENARSTGNQDPTRLHLLRTLNASADSPDFFDNPQAQSDADSVYFHSERLYQHPLFHINYTSYDVRRETDIINPKTTRRDIMCLRVLDDEEDSSTPHRFVYARVLGIYHTNVMYRGRGAADLRQRRFDFLFVRWFEFCEGSASEGCLDRVQLPPVSEVGSVGFLDPTHVLRASHIVPWYSLGQTYGSDDDSGRIASNLARDSDDWEEYFVNRFVDRDMLMRYYWGLGIGHEYSHDDAPTASESAEIATSPLFEQGGDMEDCSGSDCSDDGGQEHNQSVDASMVPTEEDESDGESEGDSPEDTLENLEDQELDVTGEDWAGDDSDFESDIQDADDEGEDE